MDMSPLNLCAHFWCPPHFKFMSLLYWHVPLKCICPLLLWCALLWNRCLGPLIVACSSIFVILLLLLIPDFFFSFNLIWKNCASNYNNLICVRCFTKCSALKQIFRTIISVICLLSTNLKTYEPSLKCGAFVILSGSSV